MNNLWYIDDSAHDGALNMALDNMLALKAPLSQYKAILRTYFWQRPTLSYGFHQKLSKRVDCESCRKHGVDLAKRPTGGRELLHDGDISFSVIICPDGSITESLPGGKDYFLQAARIIVKSLKAIGVEAEIMSGIVKSKAGELTPCLASTSQFEIVSGGKKLVPMAQRVYPESVLIHGSIVLRDSSVPTASLLQTGDKDRMQKIIDESSTNLFRILGCHADLDRLRGSMAKAFTDEFSGTVETCPVPEGLMKEAINDKNNWQ